MKPITTKEAWARVLALFPTSVSLAFARDWIDSVEALAKEPTPHSAKVESLHWRVLCEVLCESGLVTEADLQTRASAEAVTPGVQLLCALRVWGDVRVASMGRASANDVS